MAESEKTQLFPLKPVEISISGTYFRSEGLSHSEFGKDYITWHEAVEHPLTNMWQVTEVTQRPDTLTGSSEPLLEYTPVKDCLSLSLRLALEHVATFEHAQKRMGFEAAEGHSETDLGDEHIKTFAGLNGFVLDIYNKLHVTQEGRPVTKGFFNPSTIEKARADYLRKPEEKPKVGRTDLSHLFRDASRGIHDFDRLINRRIDINKWTEFVDKAEEMISALGVCQGENYKLVNEAFAGGFLTKKDMIYGESDLHTSIKKAQTALDTCTFLPSNERNAMFKSFTDVVLLAFHVGNAKTAYRKMDHSDDPEKYKKRVKETTEQAIRFAKSIGGSEQDAKRINATIIDEQGRKDLHDLLQEDYYSSDKKNMHRHSGKYRYSRENSYGSRTPDVIFMPKDIFDLMNDFHDISERMKEALEIEKKRIQAPERENKSSNSQEGPEL